MENSAIFTGKSDLKLVIEFVFGFVVANNVFWHSCFLFVDSFMTDCYSHNWE